MDNIYLDLYYFFVPNRIVWTHWTEMMGENKDSPWIPQTQYSVPYITPPSGGWNVGTIADYLGIPVGVYDSSGSAMFKHPQALPFRAYALICDQWFRDQNLTDPINITLGDSNIVGSNGSNYITDIEKGGKPFKVAKYHDYFTSCLPAPQKGPSVGFLNNFFNMTDAKQAYVPVVPLSGFKAVPYSDQVAITAHYVGDTQSTQVKAPQGSSPHNLNIGSSDTPVVFDNLFANVSNMGITINDLRIAFQLQKYYEKNSRAGTRYREILKEHFGVTTSDARMMIPEYLGGKRIPLSIHQITNQSQGANDFLGDLGAMSNTFDVDDSFIKSFEEHGFVIGVCCARYDHSYPQGLERFWCRSGKLDYYYPVFANIGEQPVFKHEIMWTNNTQGYEVFGFQEGWAEYRYKPSRVSSEMRPGVSNSLATWHLADYYQNVPSLSDSWIREDLANVDRVLSVSSANANQVFADFYVQNIATRPMPMYSIPGLIDHH